MATTQGLRRLAATFLATTVLTVAAVSPRAGDWMPLLPDQDFYDFQLFAPPDLQEYSIYPEASEGLFFSYDRLYWGITPPSVTDVGRTLPAGGYLIPSQPISPQAVVQLNNASLQASAQNPDLPPNVIGGLYIFGADPLQLDLNTGWLQTQMSWGNRYEGGWIYDGRGMAFGYYDSGEQVQQFITNSEFAASSPTQIFNQTTTAGAAGGIGAVTLPLTTTTITSNSPPPDHMISQKMTQENMTRIQSGAAAIIVRRELGRRGSGTTARFSFGPRFVQFEDRFHIGYESNQYAFNQGFTADTQGQGVNVNNGAGGAGALGGGALGGGAQAGGVGGGLGGAGGAGGGLGGQGGFAQGGTFISQTSAGDVLNIAGPDTLTGLGPSTPLQTGAWATDVFNNMVGPEIAVLFESHSGRWTFLSELKFTAAFNWQNNLYRGANFPDSIGADYLRATFNPSVTNTSSGGGSTAGNTVVLQPPPLFLQIYGIGQNNATNDVEHNFVFSPIGEWRFGTKFRVSQAITLHAGYTGLVMGSIARASSNTGYKSVSRPVRYAEVLDPEEPASIDNPWVVKTTGVRPADAAAGTIYTDPDDPYFRPNPVYNRIGPTANDVQDVVFTNGVDFGMEVRY